jgi:hypothetical protein
MQEAHERGIHRSFIQLQGVFTHLFQPPRDAIAVQRPHRVERLQDHQVQGPLQDLRATAFSFGHNK